MLCHANKESNATSLYLSEFFSLTLMTKSKKDLKTGNLTFDHKTKIIEHKHNNSKITLVDLAKWTEKEFHLAKQPSNSCISRTLRDEEKYLSIAQQDQEIRRTRVVTNDVLEEVFVTWVLQKQHQCLIISSKTIQEQERWFAEWLELKKIPEFSKRWILAFCKWNAFHKFRQHRESDDALINTPEIQANLAVIKAEIAFYDSKDIYNMNETGLFYNMPPDSTIAW